MARSTVYGVGAGIRRRRGDILRRDKLAAVSKERVISDITVDDVISSITNDYIIAFVSVQSVTVSTS